jgi:hypothetical protein
MEKPYIKLYGERHTGSKYLNLLMVINLRVKIIPGVEDINQFYFWKVKEGSSFYEWACDFYFKTHFSKTLGWKHILLPSFDIYRKTELCSKNILFLTLTKNPYAWLLSLYRNPKHAYRTYNSFEEFLTTPWKTRRRENAPAAFVNPMQMWNIKNRAYLQHKTGPWPTLNLRYEDVVEDPETWINRIAEVQKPERKTEVFENREKSTTSSGAGKKFYADYRDYYVQQRWRNDLTPHHIELINSHLDETLMAQFSYEKLAPSDGKA